MPTPKSRCKTISPGASQIISPQSITSEASCKNSPEAASSEVSRKSSPRVGRQIKISPRYAEPTTSSCNLATRPRKEESRKFSDRRSPRSQRKGPSRIAELESQISQLENDLKNVKDQLCSSETSKKQAQKDADESHQQLLSLSIKLEHWRRQISEQSSSKKVVRLLNLSNEQNQTLRFQNSDALASALHEIEQLKVQFEMVAESETQAKELVGETLLQLEMAKKMVETLRSDKCIATEAYIAMANELEKSRARVSLVENELDDVEKKKGEVERLRSALEVAEKRYYEEQDRTRNALEMVEHMKCQSGRREAELEAALRKSSYEIEELKANMMDKENELQNICDENDSLIMQLEKLKTRFKDKERERQNLSDENETLKLKIEEIKKSNNNNIGKEIMSDLRAKIGFLTEDVDKSNKKAARVMEQLEAAQKGNAEMEGELRRLKVQTDQWRKAAEAAAAILSAGNNGHLVERTGSMDYRTRVITSTYSDELDEELIRKKTANVLSRFGDLWKKPMK